MTFLSISAFGVFAKISGSAMLWYTVLDSRRLNCWKTIPIFLLNVLSSGFFSVESSFPQTVTFPLSAVSRPFTRRISVDFPAPENPMMPQISPFSTWILTSSSAWTVPYFPEKVLLTCSIWINVSSSQIKNPEAFTLPGAFSGINRKLFSVYRYMTAQQSSWP